MKTTSLIVTAASLLFLLPSVRLEAQRGPSTPTPAEQRALDNAKLLEATMSLDHPEYLPGERVRIKITFRNPTREPLFIPRPFSNGTGECYLAKKASPEQLPPEMAS